MKYFFPSIKSVFVCMLLFFFSCSTVKPKQEQNIGGQNIYLADPTIFYTNNMYYLYGTVGANANNGFLVYTSPNLKDWQASKQVNNGYALQKGDAYGTKGFWAPQVFTYNKKYYMAYVANENIAIAESDNPLGPFKQSVRDSLSTPVKQIDPFVFVDEDGKKYLYHVRLTQGNKIFVAEMTDDFSAIKPETVRECITATELWENTANATWPVTEGPTVIKHNNQYYLFYTANDFRNPDYAVGYAVSTNPMGPWKKYAGNPILTKKVLGINGTGHGDIIINKKKKIFFVFHTHNSNTAVSPRKTAIVEMKFSKDTGSDVDKVTVLSNTASFLTLDIK